MAHQESFDPKPFAPIEYRGEMRSIPTKIEGEPFCETLPKTAQVADKITVIRSMTHGEAAHERGTHNMFTGYRPEPGPAVSRAWGASSPTSTARGTTCRRTSAFPNQPNEYAGTGYLSSSFSPFSLGPRPGRPRVSRSRT